MRTAAYYRDKAARFREMARDADQRTAPSLVELAEQYEALAKRLAPDAEPPMPTTG
jgi:hypothetical protein